MSLFAGTWNGVEAPQFLAGIGVPGGDEATDAVFTTGHARDHFVFDHQRRVGHGIFIFGIGHLNLPDLLAGFGVQRNHRGVQRRHEDFVAQNGQPAGFLAATIVRGGVGFVEIAPQRFAGGGVQRKNVVDALHSVHHAIDHQRSHLMLLQRPRLKHPFQRQVFRVRRSDLRKAAEALAVHAARIREPILRFLG